AHFDPELNSLFHAFDALGHRIGHKFWKDWRDMLPMGYKGGFMNVPYREIAPPPSDETEALILIRSLIERHVGRLEELLAEHQEIEADEAAERYDRAALDCSPAFERHRRYQSARHRELLRTLETLRKMRKEEFGTGNGECQMADGKCQMADDGCRMADDRGQMADDRGQRADDRCEVRSGGCGDAENPQAARSRVSLPRTMPIRAPAAASRSVIEPSRGSKRLAPDAPSGIKAATSTSRRKTTRASGTRIKRRATGWAATSSPSRRVPPLLSTTTVPRVVGLAFSGSSISTGMSVWSIVRKGRAENSAATRMVVLAAGSTRAVLRSRR